MSHHEYTPEQALDRLMSKLAAFDAALAGQVQAAINAGKEVLEALPSPTGHSERRVYRKRGPLSSGEALQVALDALQALFVELPLCLNSALHSFSQRDSLAPTPGTLARLLEMIRDKGQDVRLKGIATLAQIGPAAATPEILAQLWGLWAAGAEPNQTAALGALRALGVDRLSHGKLKPMEQEARRGSGEVRRRACEKLARFCAVAIEEALVAGLLGTGQQQGTEILIAVELQPETQIGGQGEATMPLSRMSDEWIEAQQRQLSLLRALTQFSILAAGELDCIAGAIHKVFLETRRRTSGRGPEDASDRPWSELTETVRDDYRRQAEALAGCLGSAGLSLRPVPAGTKPAILDLPPDTLEFLARSEHERWVAARRQEGWQHGPKRDAKRRESPFLVQWAALPPEIQKWDRQRVRMLQQEFARAGYEIMAAEKPKGTPEV